MRQYLLRVALRNAEFVPGAGRPALLPDALAELARKYLLAEAVIDRLSRVTDSAVLYAMLNGVVVDLGSEEAAARSARDLAETVGDPNVTIEARYDEATESRRLVVKRMHHGTPHVTGVDADFLASEDADVIRDAAHEVVQGGAVIRRGERQQAVKTFKDALDWLLAQARDSTAIQRYKGLGEMNPEQLWETTMDAKVR